MIADRMVIGCYDKDIQMEVLSKASNLDTFKDKFDLMTSLELGKEAKTELSVSTDSTMAAQKTPYQKSKFQHQIQGQVDKQQKDTHIPSATGQGRCFGCGGGLHGRSYREHSINKKNMCSARSHQCESCGKTGHFGSVCKSKIKDQRALCEHTSRTNAFACQGADIVQHEKSMQCKDGVIIPHVQWKDGGFEPASPTSPPKLVVDISV